MINLHAAMALFADAQSIRDKLIDDGPYFRIFCDNLDMLRMLLDKMDQRGARTWLLCAAIYLSDELHQTFKAELAKMGFQNPAIICPDHDHFETLDRHCHGIGLPSEQLGIFVVKAGEIAFTKVRNSPKIVWKKWFDCSMLNIILAEGTENSSLKPIVEYLIREKPHVRLDVFKTPASETARLDPLGRMEHLQAIEEWVLEEDKFQIVLGAHNSNPKNTSVTNAPNSSSTLPARFAVDDPNAAPDLDTFSQFLDPPRKPSVRIENLRVLEEWSPVGSIPSRFALVLKRPSNNYNQAIANYPFELDGKSPRPVPTAGDDFFDTASELKERLKGQRFLIVGGFGSGSDFLSRHAMALLAAEDPNLFNVKQFVPQSAIKELAQFTVKKNKLFGTGYIFRDLFDPRRNDWYAGKYHPPQTNPYLSQLVYSQESPLLQLLQECQDASRSCYVIVTTQYDSMGSLINGINRHLWETQANEGIRSLVGELIQMSESDLFLYPRPTKRHPEVALHYLGFEIIDEWARALETGHYPFWSRRLAEVFKFAKVDRHFRPALWCRLIRLLLNSHLEHDTGTAWNDLLAIAQEFHDQASSVYGDMHEPPPADPGARPSLFS